VSDPSLLFGGEDFFVVVHVPVEKLG